jgi:hypothetical protein
VSFGRLADAHRVEIRTFQKYIGSIFGHTRIFPTKTPAIHMGPLLSADHQIFFVQGAFYIIERSEFGPAGRV